MAVDSLQLRYFVAVATLGSINKAASRLNIAQSAVSRRMAQLEHDLKVPLFHRSAVGIELTSEGRRLLTRAISLADDLESLAAVARSRSVSYPPDTIQIGMTSSASNLTLGELVRRCSQYIPDSMLRVSEATGKGVRDDLIKGSVEIAIDRNLASDPRVSSRALWSETLLLVGPKGASRRELERLPFMHAARDPDVQKILEAQMKKLRLRPSSVAQVTPASSVKRLINDGSTSILPYSMVFDARERDQFQIIPIKGVKLRSDLIWLRNEAWRDPVKKFARILEELVAELVAGDRTGFLTS